MKSISIFLIALIVTSSAPAADLREFLKSCAYGTMTGAALGVVSLALSDRPSEDLNNVARGASLGLYGGIAYGLYRAQNPTVQTYQEPSFGFSPLFEKGKMDGLKFETAIYRF